MKALCSKTVVSSPLNLVKSTFSDVSNFMKTKENYFQIALTSDRFDEKDENKRQPKGCTFI